MLNAEQVGILAQHIELLVKKYAALTEERSDTLDHEWEMAQLLDPDPRLPNYEELKKQYGAMSLIDSLFNYLEVANDPTFTIPKCGNHSRVPFGFVRLNCEYDENGVCIHCGEEIPF